MKKLVLVSSTLTLATILMLQVKLNFAGNIHLKNIDSDKVTVCLIPNGNHENIKMIEIPQNAVEAHLAHGDFICNGGGLTTGDDGEPTGGN